MAEIDAQPFAYGFDPQKTALIVVDMQRDFLEPGGFGDTLGNDVGRLQAIVPTTRRLIDGCRASGIHVIHTRECHKPDLTDCPPAKRLRGSPTLRIGDSGAMGRILIQGEPGADIVPDLYPLPGETVIDKPGKGSFYATPLPGLLAEKGITHLPRRRGHYRGLRPDHDARGQRPRLRVPAGRGRDRELFRRVQGRHARHGPRPGCDRGLDCHHESGPSRPRWLIPSSSQACSPATGVI
jgi:hypothetical protein